MQPEDGYALSYPLSDSFIPAARKAVDEINDAGGDLDFQAAEMEGERYKRHVTVVGDAASVNKFRDFIKKVTMH